MHLCIRFLPIPMCSEENLIGESGQKTQVKAKINANAVQNLFSNSNASCVYHFSDMKNKIIVASIPRIHPVNIGAKHSNRMKRPMNKMLPPIITASKLSLFILCIE